MVPESNSVRPVEGGEKRRASKLEKVSRSCHSRRPYFSSLLVSTHFSADRRAGEEGAQDQRRRGEGWGAVRQLSRGGAGGAGDQGATVHLRHLPP